jgi:pimeloyl-ACP methyl ester carboxylesterase
MSLTRPQRLLCVEKELGEMATSVELQQLKPSYDERGEGESLVLLHGGVVDARFFEPNIDALAARFRVFALDLRGHGHTPDVEGPFTYEALTQDTIVVPGTSHFLAQEKPDLHNAIVVDFLASHHVAPMRRMPSGLAA